ncbi:hypothetical protein [Streptomyces sp. NPDC059566]
MQLSLRDDNTYQLVAAGTTDGHAALIAARHHLPGTGALDDSVLVTG